MPNQINIQARTSHCYADGWADLDQWHDIGKVRLTTMRQVREGNGHDDLGTYIVHARATPRGRAKPSQVHDALAQALSISRCLHEYDCCGCLHRRARVIHRNGRDSVLRLTVGRNY